jgi:hypothetical protein
MKGCTHPKLEKRGGQTICTRCRRVIYGKAGS